MVLGRADPNFGKCEKGHNVDSDRTPPPDDAIIPKWEELVVRILKIHSPLTNLVFYPKLDVTDLQRQRDD